MKTTCSIRKMQESDIKDLSRGFTSQGWPSREEILTRYFKEQESGEREVLIADLTGVVAGYITILPDAKQGPFAGMAPELSDFNVFEAFQNQGIGNLLIEEAEKRVKLFSDKVTLGVGLHSGYGVAQRLYIKRGYIPDGSGVWYQNHRPAMDAICEDIGELVLYLSKNLF